MTNSQKEIDRLNGRIKENTEKLNALRVANARLEPLRVIYGDLAESELLARASQEVA